MSPWCDALESALFYKRSVPMGCYDGTEICELIGIYV